MVARSIAIRLLNLGTILTASALLSARAALIPADRIAPWRPGIEVGIPGGIPVARSHIVNITRSPYNADPTGVVDCHDAIAGAIDAARSGDIIYFPPGQYLVTETIAPRQGKSNYTLRGSGDASRILWNGKAGTLLYLGSGSDYQWTYPSGGVAILGGFAKGSTVLPVADTSKVIDGGIIEIMEDNDLTLPVVHVSGYPAQRTQKSRVLSHTATTITISPGTYWTLNRSLNPIFEVAQYQSSGIGIENLMIDETAGSAPFSIELEQCFACWIYSVHVRNSANYHLFLYDCLQCEVDHCNLDHLNHTGSNGAGLLIQGDSACLIQNNIIYKAFPLIEVNFGSTGNVFAYNFCYDSSINGAVGASIDSNHGPHNSYNLYEGNIAANVQCDGYYGSASDDTIFRNWLDGTAPGIATARQPILLQRFTRNYSVVGNFLGTAGVPYFTMEGAPASGGPYSFGLPNIGNSGFSGMVQPSLGIFWADWKILGILASPPGDNAGTVAFTAGPGHLATDNANEPLVLSIGWPGGLRAGVTKWAISGSRLIFSGGSGPPLPPVGTVVQIWPGTPGYQEKDLDVQATLILKANFDVSAGAEPAADQPLRGAPLPNSLYLASAPSWFGYLAWPPFDTHSPDARILSGVQSRGYPSAFQMIPAGYRFVNGRDPPGANAGIAAGHPVSGEPPGR